jgi:glycerol-3-phosphate dehydrogenase (NAD(P)+)
MKTAVLSDGAWGTALALTLLNNNHQVTLWGPFADYIEEMKSTRMNSRFLKGISLPENLELTSSMQEAVKDAEIIVQASPVQYARDVIARLAEYYNGKSQIIVNVSKGIENNTYKRMSGIISEFIPENKYAVLSGPSHAEEVARSAPTAVVVASQDIKVAEKVRDAFMNAYFRVYTSDDVIGVELVGALKNVYAIASGIIDGMKLGDNAKAALITRGIAEMARLGRALGGKSETFSGLSGIGDMIVTCTSSLSRNRHVGEELGRGKKLSQILEDMGMVVAEGVKTTLSAYNIAKKLNVETPIIDELHAGLYKDKDPLIGLKELMTRKPKFETE